MHRHEEVTVRSTAYNDRLVSSTPVLTAEERHKRQQLQRREAELQHELAQLKERYELLQVSLLSFHPSKIIISVFTLSSTCIYSAKASDLSKQLIQKIHINLHNRVKNPHRPQAIQLIIYKRGR